MSRHDVMQGNTAFIRASELAQFAYCARGWWLTNVQGIEPGNAAELEAGQAAHRRHARLVASYGRQRTMGYAFMAVAAVLALFAVWLISHG